jgi:U4/U6 small nuclear ribonucleoprotein PRP31
LFFPLILRVSLISLYIKIVTLAARVDSYQNDRQGDIGNKFRLEIEDKIEKLEAPPKARTKKALPIPEEKKRNKRGGKRVRRWKERFAMTELRKQQNKIGFSSTEGEYGDSAMGVDLGLVGASDSGKLRGPQKKEVKLLKKQKTITMSSGQTNGLSSSLVFTPVQGLELINPNAAAEKVKEANQKWFNANSGFLSAAPK